MKTEYQSLFGYPTTPSEETRLTDPDTGAQKGRKPVRMSLIPIAPLEDLARVYDYGSKKYEDHNWRKGYPWSWSYDALCRHLTAFWKGEDLDPETGLPHIMHVAWHCFALREYMTTHPEKDDRYEARSDSE